MVRKTKIPAIGLYLGLLLVAMTAVAGGSPEAPATVERARAAGGATATATAIAAAGTASPVAPAVTAAGGASADGTAATGPLSLTEALQAAINHSPELRRLRIDANIAEVDLQRAAARRWPQVSLQGSASFLANPPEGIQIAAGSFGSTQTPNSTLPTQIPATAVVLVPDPGITYFQLQTEINQPIFTWGKIDGAERVARLDLEIANSALAAAVDDLLLSVRTTYFGLVFAREAELVLAQIEQLLADIVDDRQRSYEAGTIIWELVLDARSNLAEIRSRSVQVRQSVRTAEVGLRALTGVDPAGRELADEFRTDLPTIDENRLVERAQAISSTLTTINQRTRQLAIMEQIEAAGQPFRPDIALRITAEVSGDRVPFTANWDRAWDWSVIVTLGSQLAVFDAGIAQLGVRRAQLQAEQLTIGRAGLLDQLSTQVRQAVDRVMVAHAMLEDRTAKLALAEERAKNARVGYENDMITRQEEQGAAVLSITARLDLLNAELEFENALLALEYLVGEPLQ